MSDVLARAAEVLGAHRYGWWTDARGWEWAGCGGCDWGREEKPLTRNDGDEAHRRHVAQMLADAGLLAESACPQRPTTHETLDSLTQRLMAARAATDGYRTETERLRELLDEAHAKIERMEAL